MAGLRESRQKENDKCRVAKVPAMFHWYLLLNVNNVEPQMKNTGFHPVRPLANLIVSRTMPSFKAFIKMPTPHCAHSSIHVLLVLAPFFVIFDKDFKLF
jgi:hypothetical protein